MLKNNYTFLIVLIILTIISGSVLNYSCNDHKSETSTEESNGVATYTGDLSCKNCHAAEYDQWLSSDHYMAMLPANDSTVLGDFSNAQLKADGITSEFYKENGKFFIHTDGPNGVAGSFEVKYIFGHYPLQQYLTEFPGGRLQAFRQSWDSRENKWFHQYPGDEVHHNDWLHWTNGAQTWNTMCADCHSTDLKKNYVFQTDSFHTTWSSINVSCESCHGPGSNHIAIAETGGYSDNNIPSTSFSYNIGDTSNINQIGMCAPCHSRRSALDHSFQAGNEYMDHYIPEIIHTGHYKPDGQVSDEDYVYGSFVQSKMFHNGVKCTNCHNPHSMKLKFEGNKLCTQCHTSSYDDPTHHFHKINSEAAECISCHMPSKYYMVNDLRHDHSFRIPRPDQSIKYGTPNTCKSCHGNMSNQMLADAIVNWYGTKRKYHFSDDLAPGSIAGKESIPYLINLLEKDSIPSIARATALYYLGNNGSVEHIELIKQQLANTDPLIKVHACRSLMNFDARTYYQELLPLLSDKIRAVRISAFEAISTVHPDIIPITAKTNYIKAKAEYESYLENQLDFPSGKAATALYRQGLGDINTARKYYEAALKQDSLLPGVRSNLAIIYNTLGENILAERQLKEALMITPLDGSAHYNLGLLYNEMGNKPGALDHFIKAMQILEHNDRVCYNTGLLFKELGEAGEAEKAYLEGLKRAPYNEDLNYVITLLYLEQGRYSEARKYALKLTELSPGELQYKNLLKDINKRING